CRGVRWLRSWGRRPVAVQRSSCGHAPESLNDGVSDVLGISAVVLDGAVVPAAEAPAVDATVGVVGLAVLIDEVGEDALEAVEGVSVAVHADTSSRLGTTCWNQWWPKLSGLNPNAL